MATPIDAHKVFAEYYEGCESLAYALSSKLAEGNLCIDIEDYKKELPANMEEAKKKGSFSDADHRFWVSPEEFDNQCMDEVFVTRDPSVLKPFVIYKQKAYLHRYFRYETQIIENIKRLGSNLHIITGGPGTGKTYSVATELVKLFTKNPDLKVALAAPTGKAAARMNESIKNYAGGKEEELGKDIYLKLTSLKAQTLHRLLGYIRNSVFFRHNDKNPLPYDVVVIDEASMIDGAMMAKLLNAIGDNTIFYLIGDKDQLASVEAGSVFGDICRAVIDDAEKVEEMEQVEKKIWTGGKVKRLLKNHRAEGKQIVTISKKLIEGEKDFVLGFDNNVDNEVVIETKHDEAKFNGQITLYEEYIKAESIIDALKKLNRVRVLCVTREHDHSVAEANDRIEKYLRKTINNKGLFDPKDGFYHNQPIIITKNDYNLGLNNGDVGLIRKQGDDSLRFYFEGQDGELKSHPAGYLSHYETVFAMTIHKSQGSEFDHVVVVLPEKQARKLLTRELLYTAVTRAKKKVLVQTTPESLKHCLTHEVSRASGLTQRIQESKK